MTYQDTHDDAPCLFAQDHPYDRAALAQYVRNCVADWHLTHVLQPTWKRDLVHVEDTLDGMPGMTLQTRWEAFEHVVQAAHPGGPWTPRQVTEPMYLLLLTRAVRPHWALLQRLSMPRWLVESTSRIWLSRELRVVREALAELPWVTASQMRKAVIACARLMRVNGRSHVREIQEQDLLSVPKAKRAAAGVDTLDAALCAMGVFARTPLLCRSLAHPCPLPASYAAVCARLCHPDQPELLHVADQDPHAESLLALY
jgi:hypothetical protein